MPTYYFIFAFAMVGCIVAATAVEANRVFYWYLGADETSEEYNLGRLRIRRYTVLAHLFGLLALVATVVS